MPATVVRLPDRDPLGPRETRAALGALVPRAGVTYHPTWIAGCWMDRDERPIEVVVAEFAALRSEIGYRSTTQHLLMNLNIVTTGAVVGFAIQDADNVILLLLIPLVSAALGLLYADHARSIALLAGYIHERLTYRVDGVEAPLFRWEEHSAERVGEEPVYLKYKIAVVLIFVVPSVLALMYLVVGTHLTDLLHWTAWAVASMLSSYMIVVVIGTEFKPEVDSGSATRGG